MAEIIICEDDNYFGERKGIYADVPYFAQDDFWNDRISSVMVVSGIWNLYVDHNYEGQFVTLGGGNYPNSTAIGLPNDSISSIKLVG